MNTIQERMESAEQRLLNDDGTQAPLLANEETNEDSYRIQPSLSHERKNLFVFFDNY